MITVQIVVKLKDDILDSSGQAIGQRIGSLFDMPTLKDIRQGKVFTLSVDTEDEKTAKDMAKTLAQDLLVNHLSEDYIISVVEK